MNLLILICIALCALGIYKVLQVERLEKKISTQEDEIDKREYTIGMQRDLILDYRKQIISLTLEVNKVGLIREKNGRFRSKTTTNQEV